MVNYQECKNKPIVLKWLFKIKNTGRYRARIVALGYKQEYNVNYGETYSPMLTDVILRLIFIQELKSMDFREI